MCLSGCPRQVETSFACILLACFTWDVSSLLFFNWVKNWWATKPLKWSESRGQQTLSSYHKGTVHLAVIQPTISSPSYFNFSVIYVPASSGECPVKPAFIGLNNLDLCSAFDPPSCTRCPWQKLASQKGHLIGNILLLCQVLSSRSLPLIGSCFYSPIAHPFPLAVVVNSSATWTQWQKRLSV